eukprot:09861.XXX_289166_289342_1 [CDS] Oithona nana genome sequencing.
MGQRLGARVNRYPSSGYHCSNNCYYRRSGNLVVVELSVVVELRVTTVGRKLTVKDCLK